MNYESNSHEYQHEFSPESGQLDRELLGEGRDGEINHEWQGEGPGWGEAEQEGADEVNFEGLESPLGEDELGLENLEVGSFGEILGEEEFGAHEHQEWTGESLGSQEWNNELLGEEEFASGESYETYEGNYEGGEQFFKKLRKIGRGLFRNPIFNVVKSIAPKLVATAVGGAFGPMGAMLTNKLAGVAAQALREQQEAGGGLMENWETLGENYEGTGMHEFAGQESIYESDESGHELAGEVAAEFDRELAAHEVQAEVMAHLAAESASAHEAQAFIGGAVAMTLSPRDRAAVRQLIPALIRGALLLARIFRMSRRTRSGVVIIPTLIRRTVRSLQSGAQDGQPITRRRAAQVMGMQTRRLLSSPARCTAALQRNQRYAQPASRALSRRAGSF